jgi:hypothetical protein
VLPAGFDRRLPPAHLVATLPSGETRFIRIKKLSHQPSTVQTVERKCSVTLALFRRHLASRPRETGFHYEIWFYSLSYGFRCFEVDRDRVWEIPKLSLCNTVAPPDGGIA